VPSIPIAWTCVIALFTFMATPTRPEDLSACDRLAGNPEDPQRVGPGVPFFSMDGTAAVAACASAAQSHPEIVRFKYQLGLALARTKHYEEALVPVREAAAAGYAPAEADLAYAITNFGSPPQDYGEAFRWSMRAAEQGYSPAMNDVGFDYAHGLGVDRDIGQALQWYRRAVSQGDRYAQRHLGDLYRDGLGVPQNDEVAVRWYELSAKQGYRGGETALALMLLEGRGAPRDVRRATDLLKEAAAQEYPEAIDKLVELARENMSDDEPK
jgi:TPR repeat protein